MESECQEKNIGIRHERNKNDESNTSHVLAKVGEYASVKHGYSPKAQADKSCSKRVSAASSKLYLFLLMSITQTILMKINQFPMLLARNSRSQYPDFINYTF